MDSFRIGCDLIRLNDQLRELLLAGIHPPAALFSAIGVKTLEWDASRRADLTATRPTYPRLLPAWSEAAA